MSVSRTQKHPCEVQVHSPRPIGSGQIADAKSPEFSQVDMVKFFGASMGCLNRTFKKWYKYLDLLATIVKFLPKLGIVFFLGVKEVGHNIFTHLEGRIQV